MGAFGFTKARSGARIRPGLLWPRASSRVWPLRAYHLADTARQLQGDFLMGNSFSV